MTPSSRTPRDYSKAEPRSGGWLSLVGWIALTALAGAVGAIASLDAREFYGALTKPSWAPPSSVFGPVWSTLYILMGIAAWLVWRARPTPSGNQARNRRAGLRLFIVQLALNALWTWLFFAWHMGAVAFAEICVLWLAIAATMRQFGRVNRAAGWLLAPYLAWVTFAAALTWAVWRANAGRL